MYLYFPQPGLRASAQAFHDEMVSWQLDAAEAVLMACVHARTHQALTTTKLFSVRMWRGYEVYLLTYVNALCNEWSARKGFRWDPVHPLNNPYVRCLNLLTRNGVSMSYRTPKWATLIAIRESHRSALLALDPRHYGQLFPTTPLGMPYLWPVNLMDGDEVLFDYDLEVSPLHTQDLATGAMVLPEPYQKGVTLCG